MGLIIMDTFKQFVGELLLNDNDESFEQDMEASNVEVDKIP